MPIQYELSYEYLYAKKFKRCYNVRNIMFPVCYSKGQSAYASQNFTNSRSDYFP